MMYPNTYEVTVRDKESGEKSKFIIETKDSFQAHKIVHDDINWRTQEIVEIYRQGAKKLELAFDGRKGFIEKVY
jgi:translation initiation factor IF-3|tara:strand:+ start:1026 stop:1247 length:222 start_codon:yes stop_codon:yes gene_type:complete